MYYDKKIDKAIANGISGTENLIEDIFWSIYKLLETLTIVFNSELIDSIRYKYGKWNNFRSFKHRLDNDFQLKIKRKVFRVESMEPQGNFIVAEIYHEGYKEEKIKAYLTNAVDSCSPGCRDNMVIKILDNHHTRVIFEYPE